MAQSSRPTLPSLRSLDLPTPSLRQKMELLQFNESNVSHDYTTLTHPHSHQRNRQTSVSSSITETSRCSSMSPPPSDVNGLSPPTSNVDSRYRLVRSTFENADAVLIVPPPSAPFVPPLSSIARAPKGQGLLLVGEAMHQHLRHPQRNLAKGARMHPYRIVRVDGPKKLSTQS